MASNNPGNMSNASTKVCWTVANRGVLGKSRRAGHTRAWAGDMRGRLYCGSDLGQVARLGGGGDWGLACASVLGRLAVGVASGWAEVMVAAGDLLTAEGCSEDVAEVWVEGWAEGWAEDWAWQDGLSGPECWARDMTGLRTW